MGQHSFLIRMMWRSYGTALSGHSFQHLFCGGPMYLKATQLFGIVYYYIERKFHALQLINFSFYMYWFTLMKVLTYTPVYFNLRVPHTHNWKHTSRWWLSQLHTKFHVFIIRNCKSWFQTSDNCWSKFHSKYLKR